MKILILAHFSVLLIFFALFVLPASAKEEPSELAETTKYCLQCHGNEYYTFTNTMMDVKERKRMNPYLRIDSIGFMYGEHGSFSCDDCHSPDYGTYPHNAELKMEFKYTCQDCHSGDPAYEHLQFDEIEMQSMESVHAERLGEAFKCEMCHSPHTNRLVASTQKYAIEDIVTFDNNMCLNCHGMGNLYNMFADKNQPVIEDVHDWLPNQSLHFTHVRCIECHTSRNDTMMVAHKILPKEEAVHNCTECHSTNSLLQDKLYKYLSVSERSENGIQSAISNKSYVIGSTNYKLLNLFSYIIFGLVLAGVGMHTLVRIFKRKQNG